MDWVMQEHVGGLVGVACRCCDPPTRNLINAYDKANITILDVSPTSKSAYLSQSFALFEMRRRTTDVLSKFCVRQASSGIRMAASKFAVLALEC
jgi:hypothetical protein